MASDVLMQQYNYEWKVYCGYSVFTPALFIGSTTRVKFRFEIQMRPQLNPNNSASSEEIITIYGHKSNLSAGVKLDIDVWLYYSINNQQILHFVKEIEHESSDCTLIGTQIMEAIKSIYLGNYICQLTEKDHFKNLRESLGMLIMKCRINVSEHLGSFTSLNQKLNSCENRTEFVRNITSMHDPQLHNDVKIMIEDKCLSARKTILTAQSPVFEKMLQHDFLEAKTNTITITDCSYELFEVFLKFLYTGEIPENIDGSVEELYAVADKYDVGPLRKECVRIMARDINVGNVCKVLRLANECGNNGIKTELMSFVVNNFSSLESSLEWTDLIDSQPRLGCEVYAAVHSLCHFP